MTGQNRGGEVLPASYRDPSGFLFRRDGVLYRQVNTDYREEYEHLLGSGLYAELARAGMLVCHAEVDIRPAQPAICYKILQPALIPLVSYPCEWTFSQLKDAALLTLQAQRVALRYGMTLKDASAFNVQFADGKPILIDSLSFERLDKDEPWVAYRQFCEHFLAPLALMSLVDPRAALIQRGFIDGVPLDLACSLLPKRRLLRPSLMIHLLLHARSQRRFADKGLSGGKHSMGLAALQGLVDSLESAVRNLKWTMSDKGWSAYYDTCTYSGKGLEQKKAFVHRVVQQVRPGTVWDIGANTGEFSRIAADAGAFTVALDSDIGSVERMYCDCRSRGETRILPLFVDIADPTPGSGWAHEERTPFLQRGKADLVLALALVHHLAIGRNLPLDMISELFARSARQILVEFIPKDDPQVQRLLRSRKDVFPSYSRESFEQSLDKWFSVIETFTVPDSGRILYFMTRRS